MCGNDDLPGPCRIAKGLCVPFIIFCAISLIGFGGGASGAAGAVGGIIGIVAACILLCQCCCDPTWPYKKWPYYFAGGAAIAVAICDLASIAICAIALQKVSKVKCVGFGCDSNRDTVDAVTGFIRIVLYVVIAVCAVRFLISAALAVTGILGGLQVVERQPVYQAAPAVMMPYVASPVMMTAQPMAPQGYAPPQQGYAPPQQGYAPPQQGYAPPQQGFVPNNQPGPKILDDE